MSKENDDFLYRNVLALRTGDRAAFENIYHFFVTRLYAFTRKMVQNEGDAEEIVQEVFVKLWEHRQFLDPDQNIDGYVFRIAKNIVYNKARHQVQELAYSKYLSENEGTGNTTEDQIHYEELGHLLEEAFTTMPPTRKQVFVMSRIEGLSNSEIARRLQTSNSNIENHINKALHDIRRKLERHKMI
jgi:RNA polymerase sigma-70 factor (family 1)